MVTGLFLEVTLEHVFLSPVEEQKVENRIDFLRETNARVKFLSLEPLIAPLPNMNLENIDWVIVGGESGHNPRPMDADWVLDIHEQCEKSRRIEDVYFFVFVVKSQYRGGDSLFVHLIIQGDFFLFIKKHSFLCLYFHYFNFNRQIVITFDSI